VRWVHEVPTSLGPSLMLPQQAQPRRVPWTPASTPRSQQHACWGPRLPPQEANSRLVGGPGCDAFFRSLLVRRQPVFRLFYPGVPVGVDCVLNRDNPDQHCGICSMYHGQERPVADVAQGRLQGLIRIERGMNMCNREPNDSLPSGSSSSSVCRETPAHRPPGNFTRKKSPFAPCTTCRA